MKKIILVFSLLFSISTTVFAQCSSWIQADIYSKRIQYGSFGITQSVTIDSNNNVYSTGVFIDTISFSSYTLVLVTFINLKTF